MLKTSNPPRIVREIETSEAVADFLDDCRSRGLARKTIEAYDWALAKLQYRCESLPPSRRTIVQVLADERLNLQSRRTLRRHLNVFLRWCRREYRIRNPLDQVGPLPKTRRLPRVLTPDQVVTVMHAATDARDVGLLAVVMDTGIRLGEVAGLVKGDLGPGYMRVVGKTGERQVPLSPTVQQLLEELGDDRYIWTHGKGPMTRNGLQRAYQRMFKRSGLTGEKLGPHLLRHTFGTLYVRSGGNVRVLQEIMGHHDLATTMLYVHLAARDITADHARFSPVRLLDFGE